MPALKGKKKIAEERRKSARRTNVILGSIASAAVLVPLVFVLVNLYVATAAVAAPSFEIVTTDGETLSSAGLEGDVYVLDFFFLNCGICDRQLPFNRELVDAFADRDDFHFISVTADPADTTDLINTHRVEENASWPHVRDTFNLYNDFDVIGNPNLVFIDRDGNVALVIREIANGPRLIAETQRLLDGARADGPPRIEGAQASH